MYAHKRFRGNGAQEVLASDGSFADPDGRRLRRRHSVSQDRAANTGAASPSSKAVPVTALSRKPGPTRVTPK
jgi:hypothetical protein